MEIDKISKRRDNIKVGKRSPKVFQKVNQINNLVIPIKTIEWEELQYKNEDESFTRRTLSISLPFHELIQPFKQILSKLELIFDLISSKLSK